MSRDPHLRPRVAVDEAEELPALVAAYAEEAGLTMPYAYAELLLKGLAVESAAPVAVVAAEAESEPESG